ncbi:MAG: DUF1996 domain-containing protein [Caldilinea sp. CFX5]|nr:DUF1996 domain-containing protein [Caldilinea sp. CFX5]
MKVSNLSMVIILVVLLSLPGSHSRAVQALQAGNVGYETNALAAPPIGEFVAFCDFSHRLHEDPIVFPGQPHASHSHDFFGNITTDANSTAESLLAGGTTCDPVSDRSSYWAPTLYDAQGVEVSMERATFYYLVHINAPTTLQPFPIGLKIIAGNPKATKPEEAEHIKWSCLGAPDSSTGDLITCPAGSKLELLVNYPDCWDGQNLDSANHKSHMAYSAGGVCPATHPVAVPALQFKLRYNTTGGPGFKLSSGAGYTAHADFFNAWEADALRNRLQCLHELIKCGPEGHPNPTTPPATATPIPTPTATPPPATPDPNTLKNQLYLPTVKRE